MVGRRGFPLSLATRVVDFGRALRQAGMPVDSQRIGIAQQALTLVDLSSKAAVCDALMACLLSRIEYRPTFLRVFDALFSGDPDADGHPTGVNAINDLQGDAAYASTRTDERREAPPADDDTATEGMSAVQRLRTADFAKLTPAEWAAVTRLADQSRLKLPKFRLRRVVRSRRRGVLDWRETMRRAQATDGELLDLGWRAPRWQSQPLLLLIDTSGSMAAYARTTLACLHPMTRGLPLRIFAMGHQLSELTVAFRERDTDAMLKAAGHAIVDYAGGTRLANCIDALRLQGRALVSGRRPQVVIISDGLDTGEIRDLQIAMAWLTGHACRVVWLNPLMRYAGYQPIARGPSVLAAHVDAMLAGHNLASLDALSLSLSQAGKPGNTAKP
ncbi:MAG: vWA domain-containing protein [Burkholderiaceae bacterium]